MTEQKTPREMAEQTLREREDSERRAELDRLEKAEQQRRDQQEQERQREAARESARQKAEELSERRSELEDRAEEQMAALNVTLDKLREVDAAERRELHSAGASLGAGRYQDLSKAVSQWTREALDKNGSGYRSLAEIDLLNPSAESGSPRRAPAPGMPGSDPKDEPRQRNVRFLEMVHQRAAKLRRDYGRELTIGELIVPDERETFEALSEEDRERVQAMLRGRSRAMTVRGANGYTRNGVHGNARISEEIVDLIYQGVLMSETVDGAAAYAGVSRPSIWRWRKRGEAELARLEANPDAKIRESEELYVDLCNALTHAHARKAAHDLAVISAAADAGDWRASAWRLERRYPEKWGKREYLELDHAGERGGPVQFVQVSEGAGE